jgi:hypothetical protein
VILQPATADWETASHVRTPDRTQITLLGGRPGSTAARRVVVVVVVVLASAR